MVLDTTGLGVTIAVGVLAAAMLILKGISLWLSARRKQTGWFVALLLLPLAGLLSILYLVLNRRKRFRK